MSRYIESEKVELKAKYTDTICKEIVAFLNANGGQIIIGVDDNGNVTGVLKIDETLKRISDIITMQIEPNPQEEIRTELKFVRFSGVDKAAISERNDYGYGCILWVYEKIKAKLSSENICIYDTTVRPRMDRYLSLVIARKSLKLRIIM